MVDCLLSCLAPLPHRRDNNQRLVHLARVGSIWHVCAQLWVSLQGPDAYKYKVKFPESPEVLARTVLVGNMNKQITMEQVPLGSHGSLHRSADAVF